jgi:hypothetical protein
MVGLSVVIFCEKVIDTLPLHCALITYTVYRLGEVSGAFV